MVIDHIAIGEKMNKHSYESVRQIPGFNTLDNTERKRLFVAAFGHDAGIKFTTFGFRKSRVTAAYTCSPIEGSDELFDFRVAFSRCNAGDDFNRIEGQSRAMRRLRHRQLICFVSSKKDLNQTIQSIYNETHVEYHSPDFREVV